MSKGKRVAAVYNNQEGEGSRRDYIPERPWKVSNQEPGRNSWTVQTEHNLTPANPDTSPKKSRRLLKSTKYWSRAQREIQLLGNRDEKPKLGKVKRKILLKPKPIPKSNEGFKGKQPNRAANKPPPDYSQAKRNNVKTPNKHFAKTPSRRTVSCKTENITRIRNQ